MRPERETPRYYPEAQFAVQGRYPGVPFAINELQDVYRAQADDHVKLVAFVRKKKVFADELCIRRQRNFTS